MADLPSSYVVRNCLLYAYRALRNTERLANDSLRSPYETLFSDIANALSPSKKLDFSIQNSEVESFYIRRLSENEFLANVQTRILSKVPVCGPGTVIGTNTNPALCNGALSTVVSTFNQFSLLFTVVWEMLSMQNSAICNKLPKLSGKQIWEMFLKLDTESDLKVHLDDVVDLIVRIFQANGHNEQGDNIKEWFGGETKIEFWSFFGQLTEKFVGLLQVHIVQEIHTTVVSEFLKEGKMDKKGHVVHNWKTRWFVLTASSLSYFESHENLILKGSVIINSNSLVQNMQEFKARPHRFRVVCGDTKSATEISAPSAKSMHDWIYTIRLAIRMRTVEGRNFLHKYREALVFVPKPFTLTHCASEEKTVNGHKKVASSQSVPLDVNDSPARKNKPLPILPVEDIALRKSKLAAGHDYADVDSLEYRDAPPLPPQRFDSGDVKSLTSKPDVIYDKQAFVEARVNNSRDKSKRHSSVEPTEVQHIESSLGGVYAVVNRLPKKKSTDKEITDLLSSAVQAQLPLDSTEQINNWGGAESARNPGYVQLHFHEDNGTRKEPGPAVSPGLARRIDPGKTKFEYSTIVFKKEETNTELAEKMRQNKPPPTLPAKYDGSGPSLPKHSSDSRLVYPDASSNPHVAMKRSTTSSPDLASSGPESHYVNVHYNGTGGSCGKPVVPPRRGVALPTVEQSPPIPARKIS